MVTGRSRVRPSASSDKLPCFMQVHHFSILVIAGNTADAFQKSLITFHSRLGKLVSAYKQMARPPALPMKRFDVTVGVVTAPLVVPADNSLHKHGMLHILSLPRLSYLVFLTQNQFPIAAFVTTSPCITKERCCRWLCQHMQLCTNLLEAYQ